VSTGATRTDRDRELFDAIAEDYARKDRHAACRPARRLRLERTLAVAGPRADLHLLEVGCGAGFAADYLQGRYASYLGIDHSEALVELARRSQSAERASFVAASAEDFTPERPVDAILMVGVLHHLEDPAACLRQLVSGLAPGGMLLANEPQPGNPVVSAARWVRKRTDRSYSADQVELSADQLRSTLEDAGLEEVRLVPQGLLSTPFAEVPLRPEPVVAALSRLACAADRVLESLLPELLTRRLSWNLVAAGRKPD
jgi:2-polyprenyl-3-methyl-5-hydroxy-6-metoxy-1,4-benzoquinol methylase